MWGWPEFEVAESHDCGERAGQRSIRAGDWWRVCFEWPEGQSGPSAVEIVDYH